MTKQEQTELNELKETIRALTRSLSDFKVNTEASFTAIAKEVRTQPLALEADFNIAISRSITKALEDNLKSYNSPLKPILEKAVERNRSKIENAFTEALDTLDKQTLKDAIQQKLLHDFVKNSVNASGGLVDKFFNTLKQDAAFRARLTIALDNVVTELSNEFNKGETNDN